MQPYNTNIHPGNQRYPGDNQRCQGVIGGIYEVYERIGAGNGGEVYRAYHRNLRKQVVLKRLKGSDNSVINNRTEVDILKNLRHSYLPTVMDFLQINGEIYTVMDYIEGRSFDHYLDKGITFPVKEVLIWAKQLCSVLDYLHRQHPPIIHSDLKPGNIMLCPTGDICLIDFNVSSALNGSNAWITGYTKGYAAPEHIRAFEHNERERDRSRWKTADVRMDIYSFGATIYHLLTGVKPCMQQGGYVTDIREIDPGINEVLASVIMRALAPDPMQRYQSAGEVLYDLEHLESKDRRYKNLLRTQRGAYLAIGGAMVLSAVLTVGGWFRMDWERRTAYDDLIKKESACISSNSYENFDEYYKKAVKISPKRLDAYYQKALALNSQRRYQENVEYISDEILGNSRLEVKEGDLGNIYYLLGNAYEHLEDYENAALNYKRAIDEKGDNENYYRDYAIALAYCQRLTEARQALEDARELGLSSVDLDYAEGEILYNTGDYRGAENLFRKCIAQAEDEYILMRSYLMAVKCMRAVGNGEESLKKEIELLEEARRKLSPEHNIGILEGLVTAYSDMARITGDKSYTAKSIEILEQIKKQGMGTYMTDYNLAVSYQNMDRFAEADELLQKMLAEYGDDYRTYKALAYLERAKQAVIVREQRNYKAFQTYYKKAKELYEQQLENNQNDMEMARLDELYEEALFNGWVVE